MRIAPVIVATLALAVGALAVLVPATPAGAQDIGAACAVQADAKGLHGRARQRFEARCKSALLAAQASGDGRWCEPQPKRLLTPGEQIGASIVGDCPLCVVLAWLVDDATHCPR